MSRILTKSKARNTFYGGSLFFVVVFVELTVNSHRYVVNVSTAGMPLTPEVASVMRRSTTKAAGTTTTTTTMTMAVESKAAMFRCLTRRSTLA